MRKHFLTSLLLIFLVAWAIPAQARLTLGIVADQAGPAQAELLSLTKSLSKKLQEEVSIKEMVDAAAIVNWMDQYAAIDLALLSDADIKLYRGRFLLVGPLDSEGRLNLVARQGVSPQIAQKAAELVKAKGFSPWRPSDDESPFAEVAEPAATLADQPLTIDAVIEKQAQPPKTQARTGLVLAVIKEPGGILQSAEQAAGLADYLANQLPLDVKIKEFAQLEQFTEWFMRFRMVDLAVVSKTVAETNLGRDYVAIAELVPAGGVTAATELLIGRRGHLPALQQQLREVLMRAEEASEGQAMLADLAVQSVKEFSERPVVEEQPADQPPVIETVERPVPVPKEPEAKEDVVEAPEPVMPVAPGILIAQPALALPERVGSDVPPEPAVPDLVPVVPTPASQPALTGLPDVAVGGELPQSSPAPNEPAPVAVAEAPELSVTAEMPETPPASPEDLATPVPPEGPVAVAVPTPPKTSEPPAGMAVLSAPVVPDVADIPPQAESALLPVGDPPVLAVVRPVVPAKPDEAPDVPVPVVTSVESPPPVVVSLSQPPEISPDEKPLSPEPVVVETVITEPPAASVAETQRADITDAESTVDQQVVEETLTNVEPVAADDVSVSEADFEQQQTDIIALLGEDSVAAIVAQPEIPQELRPPGIPVVRPGRVPEQSPPIDEGLFLTSLPEEIEQKEPEPLPQLLPAEEEDSGIIYIIPFVAIMVPKDVNDRIFDQFIDALIREGEKLKLQFVILKEGLKNVNPQWLKARKYVTGEIYAYVEEAGSTAIDLRAKAKLNYHTPLQVTPTFSYLHPVSRFLDPDVSTIEEERNKLADDIAEALITQFLNALQS